jgi:hypothetical protein
MLRIVYSVLKNLTVKGSNHMIPFEAKHLVKLDVVSPFNKLPEGCDNEVIPRMKRCVISYVPALRSNQR